MFRKIGINFLFYKKMSNYAGVLTFIKNIQLLREVWW